MREDGFFKAAVGITSLEDVLRVHYNETDELFPRTLDAIRKILEQSDEDG